MKRCIFTTRSISKLIHCDSIHLSFCIRRNLFFQAVRKMWGRKFGAFGTLRILYLKCILIWMTGEVSAEREFCRRARAYAIWPDNGKRCVGTLLSVARFQVRNCWIYMRQRCDVICHVSVRKTHVRQPLLTPPPPPASNRPAPISYPHLPCP